MKKVILGTDWWDDCDDVVAMRVLARAHKSGDICLKGIGINACMEYSAASLEGFLNTEGIEGVSVGIDKTATDFRGNTSYQKMLSEFSKKITSNDDAENAVRMYRRLLAESSDKVDMIEIGFLTLLADLIESEPDDISTKSGMELIKEKVSKIWVMAGRWESGVENNFSKNDRVKKAAEIFCRKCPVPVTFLGWETGHDVITGGKLDKNDILYKVIANHGFPEGRSSWDPMLVLMAIIGDEEKAGYDTVSGMAMVDGVTGRNSFEVSESGLHKYVVRRFNTDYYEEVIDKVIG